MQQVNIDWRINPITCFGHCWLAHSVFIHTLPLNSKPVGGVFNFENILNNLLFSEQEQRLVGLFLRAGESLIQNCFNLWIQQWMAFPHCGDRLLIWGRLQMFPVCIFSLFIWSLIVIGHNSSPHHPQNCSRSSTIIVTSFDIKCLHTLHMVRPEAERLLSVGFFVCSKQG